MTIPIADAGPDQEFDFGDLPIATVNLDGTGSTDPDGGSILTWSWTLIAAPPGSTATVFNPTSSTPELRTLNVPGTYRVFLIVTDDEVESSITDRLKAPESAFVHINVKSEHLETVVPAAGERNWHPKYQDFHDAVETLKDDFDTHPIADHADTTATGAELEELTDGSTTTLHNHACLAPATTTTLGTVKLADTPSDPGNPKVIVREHVTFTDTVNGTRLAAGVHPGIVDVHVNAGDELDAHIVWAVNFAVEADDLDIIVHDGGESGADWQFKLYKMTRAQLITNDFAGATVLGTIDLTQASATNGPLAGTAVLAGAAVSSSDFLVLRTTDAPLNNGPAKEPGGPISATVWCSRRG
jgi:hypothetical protein